MTRLDLNLMRALVAIYETRSVTKAAERLAVSQPTLSHSLSRLRTAYGDQLFTRSPAGLVASSLAEQVYERFSKALTAVDDTLASRERFDPLRSTRRFTLAMSDMGVHAYASPLLRRFEASAPRIGIEVERVDDRIEESLALGRTDAVIGNLPALARVARSARLFGEDYACLMSADHPAIRGPVSLDAFAAARHIVLSTPTPGNQQIDDALALLGKPRNVVARIPHFAGLSQLLVASDLLVVVPRSVGRMYVSEGRVKMLDLPAQLALPGFEVRVYWHVRQDMSTAHQWLVSEIVATLGQAIPPRSPPS